MVEVVLIAAVIASIAIVGSSAVSVSALFLSVSTAAAVNREASTWASARQNIDRA